MMKRVICWILVFGLGGLLGFWVRSEIVRMPIESRSPMLMTHLDVRDDYVRQRELLLVAIEVNDLIALERDKFVDEHGVAAADFQAVFYPQKEGNYEVVFWCSNRSMKVGGLFEGFQEKIRKCLNVYDEALVRDY